MQWTAYLWDGTMLSSESDPDRKQLLQASKDKVLLELVFEDFYIDFRTGRMQIDGRTMLTGYTNLPVHYRLIYVLTRGFQFGEGMERTETKVYMTKIGWQITYKGRNIKRVIWIRPDGSFSLEDHRK